MFSKIISKFKKKLTISNSDINNSLVIQSAGDTNLSIYNTDADLLKKLIDNKKNEMILHKLLDEKIEESRNLIIDVKLDRAEKIIKTIEQYGLSNLDSERKSLTSFLGYLISWKKSNKSSCIHYRALIDNEELKMELDIIDSISETTMLSSLSIEKCTKETQSTVLLWFYAREQYHQVIEWIENEFQNSPLSKMPFCYIYLCLTSYISIHEYLKAYDFLMVHFRDCSDERIKFLHIYTRMAKILLDDHSDVAKIDKDALYDMYKELLSFDRASDIYILNRVLIAIIQMRAAVVLNKVDLVDVWDSFDGEIQNNTIVRNAYISALFKSRKFSEAIKKIEEEQINNDPEIDYIRLSCLYFTHRFDDACQFYHTIKYNTDSQLDGMYLSAKFEINKEGCKEDIFSFVHKYEGDISSLFYIADAINDDLLFESEIMARMNYVEFDVCNDSTKIRYVILFLRHNKPEFALYILKQIKPETLFSFHVRYIYNALSKLPKSPHKEEIVDYFLDNKIEEIKFIKLKIRCLIDAKRIYAAVILYKHLYEMKPDLDVAMGIISLMTAAHVTDYDEYSIFENVILKTKSPQYISKLAIGYSICGCHEIARKMMYKALYYLNDQFDEDVFEAFMFIDLEGTRVRDIEDNTLPSDFIVELKDEVRSFKICFDSEQDLDDETNHSLGMKHVNGKNPLKETIEQNSIGDIVSIDGLNYEIINIQDRYSYSFYYVIEKLKTSDKPLVFQVEVDNDNPQKTFDQIKKASDYCASKISADEAHEDLLYQYLNMQNQMPCPLEYLALNNYSNYYSVIKELLYTADYALFSGIPNEINDSDEFVLTLSTLVLMFEFGCLDMISENPTKYCVSESLFNLIISKKSGHVHTDGRRIGKLIDIDEKCLFVPSDKTEEEMWNVLYELCDRLTILSVSNEERADFPNFSESKAERFFSGTNISVFYLDSYIIASRENKVFLSDDIFYRNMADAFGVENTNISSIVFLDKNQNPDRSEQISIRMSKTNYISPPIVWSSYDGFREIITNMINGERKRKHNMPALKRLYNLFGFEE